MVTGAISLYCSFPFIFHSHAENDLWKFPLTKHSFLGTGQTHVLLCTWQGKAHHKHLHPVSHQGQTQDEKQGPLEAPVATLINDGLVLVSQLLLVFHPFRHQVCPAPQVVCPGGRHLGLLDLDIIWVRDALVLALVDLILLIMAFGDITLRVLFWVGLIPTVIAIVVGIALVVVLVFVVVHSSVLGLPGCLLSYILHTVVPGWAVSITIIHFWCRSLNVELVCLTSWIEATPVFSPNVSQIEQSCVKGQLKYPFAVRVYWDSLENFEFCFSLLQ